MASASELLAGARLAVDEHGDVAPGGARREREQAAHRGPAAEERAEALVGRQGVAHVAVEQAQLELGLRRARTRVVSSSSASETSAPPTRTPLVLPRSRMRQPPTSARSSAWRRETVSSASASSAARCVPMTATVVSPSSSSLPRSGPAVTVSRARRTARISLRAVAKHAGDGVRRGRFGIGHGPFYRRPRANPPGDENRGVMPPQRARDDEIGEGCRQVRSTVGLPAPR